MRPLLFISLLLQLLHAQLLQLTPEQEKLWEIKVDYPTSSTHLPLGEFIAHVVTPPSLLQSISLPFEAHIKQLKVARYQKVSKGQILAEATGTAWIATQQEAISNAVNFHHQKRITQRKTLLCQEEIIPKKECIEANATLDNYRVKLLASKALLESYGASDTMIEKLITTLKLSPTLPIQSTINGYIIDLHASLGESTQPSKPLFVIQKEGLLWLESAMEAQQSQTLHEGQQVQIELADATFDTRILQLSPMINPKNQTREVRFLIPKEINTFAGLRSSATIILKQKSLKIPKEAIIKVDHTPILFIKKESGYASHAVEILAQSQSHYFITPSPLLNNQKIAISSLAILKNMLGGDDE
jgi:multidrug efflux pump subunit AcrA (membrane-fusion protein)